MSIAEYNAKAAARATADGELATYLSNLETAKAAILTAEAEIRSFTQAAAAATNLTEATAAREGLETARNSLEDNKILRDALDWNIRTKKDEISQLTRDMDAIYRDLWAEQAQAEVADILVHSDLFKRLYVCGIESHRRMNLGLLAGYELNAAIGQMSQSEIDSLKSTLATEIGFS